MRQSVETPQAEEQDPILARCDELHSIVISAYETGVTMDEAEKNAALCLGVQMEIATAIAPYNLDTKMRKSGLKAIKSRAYMQELSKHDKKPAEAFLDHAVAGDISVQNEETAFAKAEARKEELQSYLDVFKEAHIYFRGVAKGSIN